MGAGSSAPAAVGGGGGKANDDSFKDDTATKVDFHRVDKAKELSGVPLIEYKCRRKERAWKNCVKNFYTEQFLPGQSMEQEEYCGQKVCGQQLQQSIIFDLFDGCTDELLVGSILPKYEQATVTNYLTTSHFVVCSSRPIGAVICAACKRNFLYK